jgi:hypothetical protein
MKRTTNKLFLYSLTSLAVTASTVAYAEQFVTAPTLEGGPTVAIGAWLAVPSADGQAYGHVGDDDGDGQTSVLEVSPDYDWGLDASLGYVFDDTANSVELNYRLLNTNDDDSASADDLIHTPAHQHTYDAATSSLGYELNALDLMFNQFMDVGRSVQMRFGVGASYLNLEKTQNSSYTDIEDERTDFEDESSRFSGFGPRVSVDGRYEFGDGFGILGGGSVAYYVGDLDYKDNFSSTEEGEIEEASGVNDDIDNHGVTNLRANVAIDYVWFMEEESAFGLELGYQFDYYANAIRTVGYQHNQVPAGSDTKSISFSGPYLNAKGAF